MAPAKREGRRACPSASKRVTVASSPASAISKLRVCGRSKIEESFPSLNKARVAVARTTVLTDGVLSITRRVSSTAAWLTSSQIEARYNIDDSLSLTFAGSRSFTPLGRIADALRSTNLSGVGRPF